MRELVVEPVDQVSLQVGTHEALIERLEASQQSEVELFLGLELDRELL